MTPLSQYYPLKSVSDIALTDLPTDVCEKFEMLSSRFILPEYYRPGCFEKIVCVHNHDDSHSYVAFQRKQYMDDQFGMSGPVEKLMLIREKMGDVVCGSGEVRYNITSDRDFFVQKPFVGWTETEAVHATTGESLLRRGLGIRRLRLMNALTLSEYGLPLYSDKDGGGEAYVWEKLIRIGEARSFKMPCGHTRYVMTAAAH